MPTLKSTLVAALCLMAAAVAVAAPHKYKNPTPNEFPILGWSGIRGMENQTPERYREMRDCGFNLSFPLTDTIAEVQRALEASKGSGVRIIAGWEFVMNNPENAVAQLGKHPQLAGYFLKDEPHVKEYPKLADVARRIRALDDSRMLYMNLFPTYATKDMIGVDDYAMYVQRYIDEIGTGFLSYDHYSITADTLGRTALNPDYYKNLEIIAQRARNAGIPFWAFALSTAHYSFPAATRQHLRLQMFSNLAYGAQGVQYFTYWQFPGLGDSKDVPITNAGERGTAWWQVRELNREIQRLAPYFLGAKTIDVGHTGTVIPDGTHRLGQLPKPIKSLTSRGGAGLLVSHFVKGGYEYLMVVNRDLHANQEVTVETLPSVEYLTPDAAPIATARISPKQLLAPGDYLLYRWKVGLK